jgi:hypothetical protein
MPSTTVTGSTYDDTSNTEPRTTSAAAYYYEQQLAAESRLLQTCTAHLLLQAEKMLVLQRVEVDQIFIS